MSTTKGMMAEQILRRYYGGNTPSNGHVSKYDVYKLIEQFGNQELKAVRFNENLPEGDYYPTGAIIAEYDSVPVSKYKDKSCAFLPVTPIAMPRGMGIWHISAAKRNGNAVYEIDNPFIPLQSGQFGILKAVKELGNLSGIVGYEPVGGRVIFTEDIFTQGVTEVYMQLLVFDISVLDEYDIMPITPDMEARIVSSVLNVLLQTQVSDRAVDGNDKK